jgi:hypothetical protein
VDSSASGIYESGIREVTRMNAFVAVRIGSEGRIFILDSFDMALLVGLTSLMVVVLIALGYALATYRVTPLLRGAK